MMKRSNNMTDDDFIINKVLSKLEVFVTLFGDDGVSHMYVDSNERNFFFFVSDYDDKTRVRRVIYLDLVFDYDYDYDYVLLGLLICCLAVKTN